MQKWHFCAQFGRPANTVPLEVQFRMRAIKSIYPLEINLPLEKSKNVWSWIKKWKSLSNSWIQHRNHFPDVKIVNLVNLNVFDSQTQWEFNLQNSLNRVLVPELRFFIEIRNNEMSKNTGHSRSNDGLNHL